VTISRRITESPAGFDHLPGKHARASIIETVTRFVVLLTIALLPFIAGSRTVWGESEQDSPRSTPDESFSEDRIVYLNLRVRNSEVRIETVRIVRGTLKRHKQVLIQRGQLSYCVRLHRDTIWWSGVIPDPRRERYEYVDEHGLLQSTIVTKEEGAIAVRFPYRRAVYVIEFSGGPVVAHPNAPGAPPELPLIQPISIDLTARKR